MLISKIKLYLERLARNGLRCGSFLAISASEVDDLKFKFYSNHNNIQRSNNFIIHLNESIRFHLNEDSKGFMQLLVRSGYDSHYCVYF